MTLQFECGCFFQPFISEENTLQMGVACCPQHQRNNTCILHGQVLEDIEDVSIRDGWYDPGLDGQTVN